MEGRSAREIVQRAIPVERVGRRPGAREDSGGSAPGGHRRDRACSSRTRPDGANAAGVNGAERASVGCRWDAMDRGRGPEPMPTRSAPKERLW